MSRWRRDLPERLVSGDATDFERRLLDAALENRPSAAASARVARALGVSVTSIGTAAAAKALAAKTAGGGAVGSAATFWPWISAVTVGLAVGGSVVAVRARHTVRPDAAPVSAPPLVPAPPSAAPAAPDGEGTVGEPPGRVSEPTWAPRERASTTPASRRRPHAATIDGGLREQIALLDGARAALAAGSPQQALEVLHVYRERFPAGSFAPEATASTVEALVKLGRGPEARALAVRFVDEHRGTLLAKRVAGLVGMPQQPGPVPPPPAR